MIPRSSAKKQKQCPSGQNKLKKCYLGQRRVAYFSSAHFIGITNAEPQDAQDFLSIHNWELDGIFFDLLPKIYLSDAINTYFASRDPAPIQDKIFESPIVTNQEGISVVPLEKAPKPQV